MTLELHFVWNGYERHFSISNWDRFKDYPLEMVRTMLAGIVQFQLDIPIDDEYITFWKLKNPLDLPTTTAPRDKIAYPEGPLNEKAIPLDESTLLRQFFNPANPLYMKSTLPPKEPIPLKERSELWKKVSDIYSVLVNTQAPCCTGTCPVPADKCIIQYRSTDGLREINLSKATGDELERLTKACKPASFGRNDQDVLDESYRKAWKMDGGDYLINFNVEDTDILRTIKSKLVQFGNREIEAELYKLNVYGKGSFFKSHKDTPRTDGMFGSLVIVFPTAHEGGVFTLRHHDQEWATDFSSLSAEAQEIPSVGFVAFYSDIDHEVREMMSGYRVTLTYNLSFAPSPRANIPPTRFRDIQPFGEKTAKLAKDIEDVSDLDTFQRGGYLAFGLLYQYPVSKRGSVASLRHCLKGQDAALASILDGLGLDWKIRMCYYPHTQQEMFPEYILSKFVLQFEPYALIVDFDPLLPEAEYVSIVTDSPFERIARSEERPWGHDGWKLVPLTPIPRFPRPPANFIHYGNDAMPGRLYADVCIIVEVPAAISGTETPRKMAQVSDGRKGDLEILPDDLQSESE